jgi:8-amino-7-oxononanoate synthase
VSDMYFERELSSLKRQGLFRELSVPPERTPNNGRPLLNFSSNDYLGLANDARLKLAAIRAVKEFGTGSTASRLMAGHSRLADELEADLAQMMRTESALVFGSGFLTNLGVLSSVAEKEDEVFSDQLNHASIIDGIRLSGAHCSPYRHKDMDHLETLLNKSRAVGKRIIVSESVFSMDGDVAPVRWLSEMAERYGAVLVIDEAHAIGVMGEKGGGVCRITENDVQPDLVVGTLSKALGSYGGFVACSNTIRQFLINKARTFIYSTALPPACLGSAREAVSIVSSHPEMGRHVLDRARVLRDLLAGNGLSTPPFESQIVPVLVGANEKALQFAELLIQRGLGVRAVRPPTVPSGTARVRLSITLSMACDALEDAAGIMVEAAREAGLLT